MAVSDNEPGAQQAQGRGSESHLTGAEARRSGAKATPLATFFLILLLPTLILLAVSDPSSLIKGYKEDVQIPPEPPSRGEPSLSPTMQGLKMAPGTDLCAPKTHVLKP